MIKFVSNCTGCRVKHENKEMQRVYNRLFCLACTRKMVSSVESFPALASNIGKIASAIDPPTDESQAIVDLANEIYTGSLNPTEGSDPYQQPKDEGGE